MENIPSQAKTRIWCLPHSLTVPCFQGEGAPNANRMEIPGAICRLCLMTLSVLELPQLPAIVSAPRCSVGVPEGEESHG
jgi:hypothetical protein